MNDPKISIIIPVYNTEIYIAECLESIINQTYKNLEIICIDDGSSDNSLSMLRRYEQKDNRIKIFTQKNSGQGICRNNGIKYATGEYIMFVDSDDWLDLSATEEIVKTFTEKNAQVIQFDFTNYFEINNSYTNGSSLSSLKKKHKFDNQYNWHDIKSDCLFGGGLACWQRAYSKNFLISNNIEFSPHKYAEDVIFKIKTVIEAEKIHCINKPLYFYRIRNGSAVNSYSLNNFCIFEVIKSIENYLNEKNLLSELNNEFNEFKIQFLIKNYKRIPFKNRKEYKLKCSDFLTEKEIDKISGYTNIPQKFFSMKNEYQYAKKYKIITFLGCEFTFCLSDFMHSDKKIEKTDMVYLWCDISDKNFREKKAERTKQYNIEQKADNICRFTNNDELKYSLRSLSKHAKFINKIYIVTDNQIPKWLNTNNKKIKIIDHKEIIPKEALPTFNSNPIEHCIKNIPELSEHFLYANDDMFFYDDVTEKFFFNKNNYPINRTLKHFTKYNDSLYQNMILHTKKIFFEKFKKNINFMPHHNIDGYKKSDITACYNIFKKEIDETIMSPFRRHSDIQRILYSYYSLMIGHAIKKPSHRSFLFFKKIDSLCFTPRNKKIEQKLKKYNPKLFCINDDENTTNDDRIYAKATLEKLFPEKSEFEL